MTRLPAMTLLAAMLALAGCEASDTSDEPPAAMIPAVTRPPPLDQPAQGVPPATVPPGTPMPGDNIDKTDDNSRARWDGYADARFGMSADEVVAVWDGELDNLAEGKACYHMSPVGQPNAAFFALMFGDGEFVRYSVSNDEMTAPGGGKRGMDDSDIGALYAGRIERSPHKYVDGEYLRIAGEGESVLIFETDADGTVTEWRVGLPPQVDYVEGCS